MRFMTPNEAAQELEQYGMSRYRIRKGAANGEIPHIMVGGHVLVDVDALRATLDAQDPDDTIGTDELKKEIGLTACAIRRGVREGWIPAVTVGGKLRFRLDEVKQALMERMKCVNG